MSMIRVLLPVPVKTYKLHGKYVCTLTAMTATSVSELLIMTALCSRAACCACKNNNTNRLYTLLNSHTVTLICMCKQRFLPTIVRSAFFHTTYRNSVFVPSERNFFHWVGVL